MKTGAFTRFEGCGIGDEAASDLGGQLAVHTELGWGLIELRTIEGAPLAALKDDFDKIAAQVLEAAMRVTVLDSNIGRGDQPGVDVFARDVEELEILASLALKVGANCVRVMSYPNEGWTEAGWRHVAVRRLRELTNRAEQYGLMLLHENCSGWGAMSAARALDLLEGVASPAFRLLFDTGNGVAHGYDGLAYLEAVAPFVEHVHVKDTRRTGPQPDDIEFVMPGDGDSCLIDCLRVLARHGFSGTLSIEPHIEYVHHLGRRSDDARLRAAYVAFGRATECLAARALDPLIGSE